MKYLQLVYYGKIVFVYFIYETTESIFMKFRIREVQIKRLLCVQDINNPYFIRSPNLTLSITKTAHLTQTMRH